MSEPIPNRTELMGIIKILQTGYPISDSMFDSIYPKNIQKMSANHWTPVEVAKRAAELLVTSPQTRVLDVGSGAGKFCLVAALTSTGLFVGIEQRNHLVELCNNLKTKYEVENALFFQGNMTDINWTEFDAFYLFNPFVENLYDADCRIDNNIAQTRELYERYVRTVQAKLHFASIGTRVVTFHGFGGEMPPGYICQLSEPMASDKIELWIKES